MLAFLFLFLSFAQVGLLGLGGSAGSQALLEHELLTLHHWLSPEQLADLMVFCRTLPGGTGLNAAVLGGSAASAASSARVMMSTKKSFFLMPRSLR